MSKYLRSKNILSDFVYCGNQASFHYASENLCDWDEAKEWVEEAMKLFEENRGLRAEMRALAQKFLWFTEFERERAKRES